MNPNKPNSANSNVVNVKLDTITTVNAFIPGEGHHGLFQRSIVLLNHGNVNDLPGVSFNVISNKYDCSGVLSKSSFSKYGASSNS